MARRITQAVTVLRAETTGERDARGNPIRGATREFSVGVFAVEPTASDETTTTGTRRVITGWRVYAPLNADIQRTDRVRLRSGEVCSVIGRPAVWDHNPHVIKASQTGLVVDLKLWQEGA